MSRPRRRQREQPVETPAPAFLTRSVAPYEIASEDILARIEDKADRILAETGAAVRHEPSLRLLRAAGCRVDGDRVRFEPGFCRALIRNNAPKSFVQHARDPAKSVNIGGDACVLVPVYGSPFVAGMDVERHYGTIADFDTLVKLAHTLPQMHHTGGTICEPTDIPVSKRHLDMLYSHIRYSDKAFMGSVTAGERAEDSLALCEIVFGKDFVERNCVLTALINLNSPLVLDETMLDAAHIYAAAGQACVVTPFIISGASGPTTVAGCTAQSLAECLAGLAILQLVRPGAPMVLGHLQMAINMRTGGPLRFDETWKSMLLMGQLARRLGIPYRTGGSSTSSKALDAQAGWEGALYMIFSLLSGVNFFIHATGNMEAGLLANFEKFVLDCDVLGAATRMLEADDMSDDAFGLDAIEEAGPGGNFLAVAHTMARYKTAFYESTISDGTPFEQWQAEGCTTAEQRANLRLKQLLSEYREPLLDPSIDEALRDYIKRRKAQLPDSFA